LPPFLQTRIAQRLSSACAKTAQSCRITVSCLALRRHASFFGLRGATVAAKIIIVEDEQDLSTLLRFIFEKFGYAVMEAHNGQEALDLINAAEQMPDVVITDVMMPVMDGYTLVTQLQENYATRKVPVIIMTAKGQTRELFRFASIAGFIEKPFEPKTLKELVDKVVAPQ